MNNSIPSIVRRRAAYKAKITNIFDRLEDPSDQVDIQSSISMIQKYMSTIDGLNDEILEQYSSTEDGDVFSNTQAKEISSQTNYELDINSKISALRVDERSPKQEGDIADATCFDLKLPKLECGSFSGENSNSLEYFSFISNFNNIVGNRNNLSNAVKLTYLKSYLRGYAAKIVQHLQVTSENFHIALGLLEIEFLDKDNLTSSLFDKILNLSPKFDQSFNGTKLYINEIRCVLSDLRLHGSDLQSNVVSNKFVSHIVASKLPKLFRQELSRKLDNNYPSLENIFENYVSVINTLNIRKPEIISNQNAEKNKSVNFSMSNFTKTCKFCNFSGHSMFKCKKYATHKTRVERCKSLKLCSYCTSSKHETGKCSKNLEYPCNICSSKEHVSALCPRFVTNQFSVQANTNLCSSACILPTLTITVIHEHRE